MAQLSPDFDLMTKALILEDAGRIGSQQLSAENLSRVILPKVMSLSQEPVSKE